MVSGAAGSGEESPNRQAPGPGYDLAKPNNEIENNTTVYWDNEW